MSLSSASSARWSRFDVAACLSCCVLGLILAIEPHLAMCFQNGALDYLADNDDVLYLTIARPPYHGEWTLRDPFLPQRESMPTLYAWTQFVPLSKLARLLRLPLPLNGLLWRGLGGPLLGFSVYFLFRRLLANTRHPVAWSLGCAAVCLSDAGFEQGRFLIQNLVLVRQMMSGTTPFDKPDGLPQYRVVTPLLNLPFLLLLLAVLVSGIDRWKANLIAGIALLGLCFQLYFFFWTAAVAAIGMDLTARLAAWAVGRDRSPEAWAGIKLEGLILVGGLIVGAPQVYVNVRTFSDPSMKPALERTARGQKLDRDDPVRTANLLNRWVIAKLIVGGALILALGACRFRLLWWTTFASYLLNNSALATGLEFENFHWSYVFNATGEIMVLGLAALGLDLRGSREVGFGAWRSSPRLVARSL